MRAPLLVLGLVSAPVLGALAQGGAAVKDPAQCAVADAHRSSTSLNRDPKTDPFGRSRTGCSAGAPAPLPPPPPPPPPPGTGAITGQVRNTLTGSGLAGWVIVVTGQTSATATTDANGNYVFPALPAGTYVVCQQVQTGWSQVTPMNPEPCASGFGYNFSVPAGGSDDFVNFGNQPM